MDTIFSYSFPSRPYKAGRPARRSEESKPVSRQPVGGARKPSGPSSVASRGGGGGKVIDGRSRGGVAAGGARRNTPASGGGAAKKGSVPSKRDKVCMYVHTVLHLLQYWNNDYKTSEHS